MMASSRARVACFDLAEDGGELILTVTAPEGAERLALDLVGAFAAPGNSV